MQQLTEIELQQKRRCIGCGKTMSQLERAKTRSIKPKKELETNNSLISLSEAHEILTPDPAEPPPLQCKFHPGQVLNKKWTCCGQQISPSAKPCGGSPDHIPRSHDPLELVNLYQFHHTPVFQAPLPKSRPAQIRAAVAIDCEMGTAVSGDSELIRITVIDYFTSAILLNSFVEPDVPMSHLNTKYSGVTWADIRNAKRHRRCLMGTRAARRALWQFVDPQTVVIGHGASSDLRALRWIHEAVVDSASVEASRMKKKEEEETAAKKKQQEDGLAEDSEHLPILISGMTLVTGAPAEPKKKKPKGTGDLALKTLAKKYLNRDIQTSGQLGHDSLEDAVAARDVVHWIISDSE